MDMGDYVNSPPVNEAKDTAEKTENCHSGRSKVYRVVGVSFGLLCIIQSVLNVSLRLQGTGSNHINSTSDTLMSSADTRTLLLEKEQLAEENTELQANYEMLNEQLSQREDKITELQSEIESLLSVLEPKTQSCPQGWLLYMSSCYYLSTERKNWRNARNDCVARGADLIILNNEMEEDALRNFGSAVNWIGLRATQRGQSRTWTWVDGSQLTNANRITLQPDDQLFDCAYAVQPPSYRMQLVPADCTKQHYWVCERKVK